MSPLGFTAHEPPADLVALPAKLLACQHIPDVAPSLGAALGLDPDRHRSAGLVTCTQDDALYVALDQVTKFADVDVVFAKSFYAGADHASGPYSGEILGILAGSHPDHIEEALWTLRELLTHIHFHTFPGEGRPAFFGHVVSETGTYLPTLADGIAPGDPMAYLIAPPIEAMLGVDAALKAADVQLAQLIAPPSETNFGGAFLTGALHDLEAATAAFVDAIRDIVASPHRALRRPGHLRR